MISALDLGWAAGFIEGEGYIRYAHTSCEIRVGQLQRAPLEKLQALFGGKIRVTRRYVNRHGPQEFHTWTLLGKHAAGLTMTLWSLLSPNRREQAAEMLRRWRQTSRAHRYKLACPRGHAYSDENTRRYRGMRYCRTCDNLGRHSEGGTTTPY